jgi:histidinol-phosphatase
VSAPSGRDGLVRAAREAAEAAGAVALRYFREGVAVDWKADQSPVTRADRESEETIVSRLSAVAPGIGFLGEEFGAQGSQERRWIIDPIDATRNFVRGIPYWAVLIALEEAGEITVGVVHAPATGETLWGARGLGAFSDRQRLQVSGVDRLDQALLVHSALRYMRQGEPARYWEAFLRLVDLTDQSRGFGDWFGYTFVLRGRADLMVEADVKPWDLAPFVVLFEEAGGRLTDFAGRRSIYSGTAVASNGRLHDRVLEVLGAAGR